VDAIKKKMLSTNKVSLALDRWASMNKLAITSVIAYYMNYSWALQDGQLTSDEVSSISHSYLRSQLWIDG
jgi:hypothetical protein